MRPAITLLALPAYLGLVTLAADSSASAASTSAGSSNSASSVSSSAPATSTEASKSGSNSAASSQASTSSATKSQTSAATTESSSSISTTISTSSSVPTTVVYITSTPSTSSSSTIESSSSTSATTGASTSLPAQSSHKSSGLSTATKAIIAVCSAIGAALIIGPIFFLIKWNRRKKKLQEEAFADALRQSQVHEEMAAVHRLSSQPSMNVIEQRKLASPTPPPMAPNNSSGDMPPAELIRSMSPQSRRESRRSSADSYKQRDSWRGSPEPRRDSWNSNGGRFYEMVQQNQRPWPETIHENPASPGEEDKMLH